MTLFYTACPQRRLRFREHLCDVEKDDKETSKPVCKLINHSTSRKHGKPQKFIFQTALLILTVSTNAFHLTNLFCSFSRYHAPTNTVASSFCIQTPYSPQFLDSIVFIDHYAESQFSDLLRK